MKLLVGDFSVPLAAEALDASDCSASGFAVMLLEKGRLRGIELGGLAVCSLADCCRVGRKADLGSTSETLLEASPWRAPREGDALAADDMMGDIRSADCCEEAGSGEGCWRISVPVSVTGVCRSSSGTASIG